MSGLLLEERRVRRFLTAGWIGLLVFLILGMALEGLHAVKAASYLKVGMENRRLLWTLAHAHGTLFSLVQIAMGLSGRACPAIWRRGADVAWWGILGGQILMPAGFLLGGFWLIGDEPGLLIFLAPVGAVSFAAGVGVVVWNLLATPAELGKSVSMEPVSAESAPPGAKNPTRRARRTRG